jgi:hypothetical protein
VLGAETALAQATSAVSSYAEPARIDSRLVVWVGAQLHLMFAAFVLAVPMFALYIECTGWRLAKREPATAARYDWLAHEMARLLPPAYSLTAITGAFLGFALFAAYPGFMAYMTKIFGPTFVVYPLFFVAETLCLYLWYYTWDRLQGDRKWMHIVLGVLLNLFGTMSCSSPMPGHIHDDPGGSRSKRQFGESIRRGVEPGLDAAQCASARRQYYLRRAAVCCLRRLSLPARSRPRITRAL